MLGSKSPLGRARGLGAAGSGTEDLWRQRLTALFGLPLTVAFILIVLSTLGADHADASATLGRPLIAIALILTIVNTGVHMRLGMRVVIEDYVHGRLSKKALLMANTAFTAAVGATGIFAVLSISFGG